MGGLGAALFLAVMIIPRIRGGSSEAARSGKTADIGHKLLWQFKSEHGAVTSIALGPDGSVKWSVKSPQQCTSGAAIAADGTLYIGGDMGLFALHADG